MPPEINMEPLIDADAEYAEPIFKLIASSADDGPISKQASVGTGTFGSSIITRPPQIRSLSLMISPTER